MLHQFRREAEQVEECAKAVLAVSREHRFAYYQAWAEILAGWAYTSAGAATDGILRVRQGLAGIRATGAELRLPYYLGLLGELHLEAGQAEAGASALGEAFAIAERNGESWNDGNLWLLKGDICLVSDEGETAEGCYAKAIEISHAQGARSLALRARLRLARRQAAHGCRAEALALIAPLANWFDPEAKTSEINEARALVESLA
jgi:tetratricopeptide (TPR) repeat protein